MDSEDAQRDDRFARYVLTGLIVTVCTWALTLIGVADSVIPYVLPPAILILCGRYILVGSISDVEPQAHALASVVGGIALGLVAASGSGYFFTPVPAAGVKGGWMFATAFVVWVLYRMHIKYETGLLEKVVCILVPGTAKAEKDTELDERLLATPTLALQQCHTIAVDMARDAVTSLKEALQSFEHYTPQLEESIRSKEDLTDHYEDILGSYLIKLSSQKISSEDGEEVTMLMKIIGDFERISDHAVNVLEASTEMREKELSFSDSAKGDFKVISAAVEEILDLSYEAFADNNINSAVNVEPLEQVIDALKEEMRTRHILRMQQGNCNVIAGFVWSDLLTCLERTSDHCSNIAGCVIDVAHHELHLHETLQAIHEDSKEFQNKFEMYSKKYAVQEL